MRRDSTIFTVALVFLLCTPLFAATFTVTKIADTNDGTCDADCSFREAVAAAVAAATDDEIVFDLSVFSTQQTIILSGTEIVITANGTLAINGPGADLLTIDGNSASRIITINTATVSVDGITFTGGNGVGALNTGRGGAIYNAGGTTVIANSIITDNSGVNGGGLNNASTGSPAVPGNLALLNCIVSDNNALTSSGGGMQNFSTSTLIIDRSLFLGNNSGGTTGGGGGQFNGIVRISNTTFANNTAPSGSGGGFQSNGSNQIYTNITVSGNSSLNNGGGIHRGTTNVNFWIRNSIVSGNNGTAASPDVTNSSGGLVSEGTNIVGITGTSTGWIGSDLLDTDPLLLPLADNGGFSQSFLPMTGSPAINGGQNCVTDLSCASNNPPFALTEDQRGSARLVDGTIDIGAVETAAGPATVSGTVQTSSGTPRQPVYVSISDGGGVVQTVRTNGFGRFVFVDIPTGVTYTISASAKGFAFGDEDVEVNGDVTGVVVTENVLSPAVSDKK
ncbi:MAG TPA: choice-of-anchor Q domain-containing protein [Aridibacter sp.]|nr:choice-of-anchor Q domain-containing protein [Aridibacter sp.]